MMPPLQAPAADQRKAVLSELGHIIGSPTFSRCKRLKEFMRFTLTESLEGRGESISEWAVGVAVYERDVSYDPQLDSIVRSEARRLRAKLREYYSAEGKQDPLRIEYPKGSYVPIVRWERPVESPAATRLPERYGRSRYAIAAALLVGIAMTGLNPSRIGAGSRTSVLSEDRERRMDAARGAHSRFVSAPVEPYFRDAERRLDAILREVPLSDATHALLGSLYEKRISLPVADRDTLLSKALSQSREAVRLNPRNGLANATLGWLLVQQRETMLGMRHVAVALSSAPNDPEVHLLAGNVYLALGFYESALFEFRESVRLDTLDGMGAGHVADTLALLGQRDEAQQAVQELLIAQPFSVMAALKAANAALRLGDLENARKAVDIANAAPADPAARDEIAIVRSLIHLLDGDDGLARAAIVRFDGRFKSSMDHQIRLEAALGRTAMAVKRIQVSPVWRHYRFLIACPELRRLRGTTELRELARTLFAEWKRDIAAFGSSLPASPPALDSPESAFVSD